ncbi:MAG: chemotaxis protein CheW [Polyangiaceae bacterium]
MKSLTRSRQPRTTEAVKDAGGVTEYLGFKVASITGAFPVSIVREIARTAPITPVPRAPNGVLGITSFRGRVVTVIDLGQRMGLASSTIGRSPAMFAGNARTNRIRVLMVDVGQETIGFVVDEVLLVYRFGAKEIERATHTLGTDVGAHVVGIARPSPTEVVLLLEAKALLP